MEAMKDYLTTEEVAELLRVQPKTVRRMLCAGELPGVRVGKAWRVPRVELARRLAPVAPVKAEAVKVESPPAKRRYRVVRFANGVRPPKRDAGVPPPS
jgi:excisionase family DNA binding protein